ncbi:MAG: zinc ABC transporter substrate-binding protein [Candidatus Rokubacteria bacterium]|nr:zinc ABC transporter substrate-binding protein [Candidatus Rokubacteria bacterium]
MTLIARLALAIGAAVLLATAADAAKIRVVATIPDLKALTEAVGGDLVDVEALARGSQNPHDVEMRPSLLLKLRRADLLVVNGLDLDFWIDPLVQNANNPQLLLGAPGRVDVSRGVSVRDVPTGRVDRSMGDVHPSGNPHYTLDPGMAPVVTANIVEGLVRVAPAERARLERRRQEFLARLAEAQARWTKALEPFRGTRVVVNHNLWPYFLGRFGLELAGTVEEKPGIPPSPGHVSRLIRQMKDEGIRVLILEAWGDRRLAERIAAESGARLVVLASAAGAAKGTETYIDLFEHNVTALAQALR